MDAYQHYGYKENEVIGTLTAGQNKSVRGDTALVVEPVVYPGVNITSPINGTNPQPGDPCHTLTNDNRNYVVFTQKEREEVRDLGDKSGSISAEPGTHQQTYVLENHPNDSRIKICEDDTFQTLSGRMGTGGNNTPMVMETSMAVESHAQDARYNMGEINQTLGANMQHDPANGGLVYGVDTYNQTQSEEQAKTLNSAATDSDHIPCTYTLGGNIHMNWEELYATATRNPILCILQETYGTQKVFEWGIAVLATLQSTDILRQGVYESSISCETENGYMLDDDSQICSTTVAKWILRDMRKQQECGCTSQGWQPTEQRSVELAEIMQELPYESSSASQALFNMWGKGERLWLLQQTLYQIQEIWRSANMPRETRNSAVVRRLTPTECMRLQNFPDGWCDIGEWVDENGKKHKDADAPKYKALGNSIALPFWQWLAYRVTDQLKADGVENPTLASLFDGISGFPLVFLRAGAECKWTSEIESYPIAVCKKHFGDEDLGIEGDVEKYL